MPEQILYFHTYPELELGSPRERDESLRGVHLAFCAEWRKGGLAAAEPHLVLVPKSYRQLSARELARRFLAANFPGVNLGRGRREALVGTYQLGPLNLAYLFLRTNLPSLDLIVWPEDTAHAPALLALPAPQESCSPTRALAGQELDSSERASAVPSRGRHKRNTPRTRQSVPRILRRRSALWAGASTAAAAVVLAAMRFPPAPGTRPSSVRSDRSFQQSSASTENGQLRRVPVRAEGSHGPAVAFVTDPRQPSIGELWVEGAAHYHAGELVEARRLWREALERDPRNLGLQESVQKAEAKLRPQK